MTMSWDGVKGALREDVIASEVAGWIDGMSPVVRL